MAIVFIPIPAEGSSSSTLTSLCIASAAGTASPDAGKTEKRSSTRARFAFLFLMCRLPLTSIRHGRAARVLYSCASVEPYTVFPLNGRILHPGRSVIAKRGVPVAKLVRLFQIVHN